jgi:hypothetical protein
MFDKEGGRAIQSLFRVCPIFVPGGAMSRATAVADQYTMLGRGLILLGAFVSFVLSVSLWFTGHHEQGIFVGLWVPSILALGGLTAGSR